MPTLLSSLATIIPLRQANSCVKQILWSAMETDQARAGELSTGAIVSRRMLDSYEL